MTAKLINPKSRAVLAAILIAATPAQASIATYCRVDTSAIAITVLAPRGAQPGDSFSVADISNNAATRNITVNGNGATIDGAATLVLNTNGVVASFMWDGAQWVRVAGLRVTDDQTQEPVSLYGTDTGGGTTIPDPLVVNNLVVNVDASVGNNLGVTGATSSGSVAATGAVTGATMTATGQVQGDVVRATTRMVGPFFTAEVNPALVGASGYIRAPDADVEIVTGVAGGSTLVGLAYASSGAAWVFGNTGQYSNVYGYAVALSGGQGCSAYDGRSGVTTDLTRVEQFLTANADTTNLTRTSSPFTWAMNANEDWVVELDLWVQNSSGNGLRFAWDLPAGATVTSCLFGCTTGANAFTSIVDSTANALIAQTFSNAAAALRMMRVVATIRCAGTPGNATFQFAAVTSGTARIGALSKMTARRATAV